jgi:translation initiation factor 1
MFEDRKEFEIEKMEEFEKREEIHIRIQQRNGRKYITLIEGLSEEVDLKKFLQYLKKSYATNGTILSSEHGEIIQLQGDQRANVFKALTETNITKKEYIKVHG